MVEIVQRCPARLHIGKSTQPDEAIRVGAITKLTEDERTIALLFLNEIVIKHGDELIAFPREVNILTQFYDRTTGLRGLLWETFRACGEISGCFNGCFFWHDFSFPLGRRGRMLPSRSVIRA